MSARSKLTVRLDPEHFALLDMAVDDDAALNRSEAIRNAIEVYDTVRARRECVGGVGSEEADA